MRLLFTLSDRHICIFFIETGIAIHSGYMDESLDQNLDFLS